VGWSNAPGTVPITSNDHETGRRDVRAAAGPVGLHVRGTKDLAVLLGHGHDPWRRDDPDLASHRFIVQPPIEPFLDQSRIRPRKSLKSSFNEILEGMDAGQINEYIADAYAGVAITHHAGDTFFIYDPGRDLPPERQMPFITTVTSDNYDTVSNLNEPGTYRLNIGLTRATFTARFSTSAEIDYAERDKVMPHPTYAGQYWVCVVNPSDVEALRPLLDESYEFAVRKYENHRTRHSGR
jgi:hypothetical protein